MAESDLAGELDAFLAGHQHELIEFRRDLHAHPEVGYSEHRTTRRIALRLEAAGLRPAVLPKGTGLIVDIGGLPDDAAAVALRADIDGLPIVDEKNVPYRSLNAGVCHACGHDVHTSVLLGTGLFLARAAAAGALPGKVRLIFQPAEEVPGGALDVLAAGGISSVDRVFALHCDPKLDVGKIGTRIGPITAACDKIKVHLSGPGGHTARPHLTADLIFALGKIITELPAALSRRIDPRSGLSLVWGRVSAGSASNAIPDSGVVEGTVRCLDDSAWHAAPEMLKDLIESVASSYGVTADLTYERSVPPAVNESVSTAMVGAAADRVFGPDAITPAPQSLGGEDFAWYLESVPGSLFRLGTRRPGSAEEFDIHQPMFDVDERCIAVGVKVMAATAMTAIGSKHGPDPVIAEAGVADRAGPLGSVRASADGVTLAGPLLASYSSVAGP
ncbi:MAG TPA: amidohydrolase [Streptosporangiaceae bacterium]|nr:amidohydrolase [Streptosporangiaceae bacterium]